MDLFVDNRIVMRSLFRGDFWELNIQECSPFNIGIFNPINPDLKHFDQ